MAEITLASALDLKTPYQQENVDLIGTHWGQGEAEKAMKTDATLATAWLGLVSVMVSAEIDVKPCGADPKIVDFVKEALFKRANRRFADYHTEMLNALLYGVAPAEITAKYVDGKWWLKDIAFIHPRHFDLWSLRKEPGQWWVTGKCYVNDYSVRVGAPGTGLPIVWWPVYGSGLLGESILSPVINEHKEKDFIRNLRRVALNKSIMGTLCGLQRDPSSMVDELTDDERTNLAYQLAVAASGTNNAAILPPQISQIQPIYPASDSISKSVEAEDHADLQILQAFGSQHLARGLLSGYGSQGAGETDSRAQQALRDFYFQWVARQFQDIIDWLVELNFGHQAHYPELSIVSAAPQSPESLVRSAVQLASSGAITFSEADEAYFRRLLRMPEAKHSAAGADSVSGEAVRVPGSYDAKTGLDTRDRANEYKELKGE